MKIVVLAGGLSPERDVSLSSGALIANALIDMHHEVMLRFRKRRKADWR